MQLHNKKFQLELKAELNVPYDPDNPQFTQSLQDMIVSLTRAFKENRNGYAVCSNTNIEVNQRKYTAERKYTADLRITDVKVIGPCCPTCNHILENT